MELSYWEKQSYFSHTDLLIIGSGIVGLNAAIAYKTKYPKAKVLVAERGLLPLGASTKNAGFACFGSVSELADDLTNMPENTVWATVKLRNGGLKKLKKLVGEKNMNYLPLGGFEVFDNKEDFEKCAGLINGFNKKMQQVLRMKNVYSIVNKKIDSSGLKGFAYCIKNKFEGQINTGMMMQALLALAHKKGIIVLNGLDVEKIEDDGKNAHTQFKNNLILQSKKIIVATNGFAKQLLPQLDVKPARAQVLVTAPIKNLKLKGAFHYQKGYYYFRNIDGRILLGGGRNLDFTGEETTQFGLTEKIQNKLESLLKENIIPGIPYQIEQRWSGIMGVGSEKKPIISHISKNVVCAVRMGGMGVAIGSLVGQMAVDELTKK
ncbi:MAG TPA: FAD-dependent oxidoreductase [Bacteroidia bacterium]|jgi:gamma-glutamylputrescine oxidase|nr:FAD-dependent oxidoreductase [Bacteroidia bacterium]